MYVKTNTVLLSKIKNNNKRKMLPGKISTTSDTQMSPSLWQKAKEELKSLLMKAKEESEKVDLKLNIQKIKTIASSPITSWQIDGETMEIVRDFILGGLQNHCRW